MQVITISGKARHGKDTVAKMMAENLKDNGYRVLITHNADLLKYVCKMFFGWNGKKDASGRTLLQYIGTDIVRKRHPDFWVNFIIDILSLFSDQWDYVIIPDTRFPNEISRFRECGFDTRHVRVVRPLFDNGLSEEQNAHPSETALDNTDRDWVIINSGDLSSLKNGVREFVRELLPIYTISIQN